MKTITVKTNIMCASCIAKVTPVLDKALGRNEWKVDITNPQKILSVTGGKLDESGVIKAVEEAGYKAEKLT